SGGSGAALPGSRRASKSVPVAPVDGQHARGDADEGTAEDSEAHRACGPADECADADARGGHAPEQRAGPCRLERRAGTGLHRREHTKPEAELVTAEIGSVRRFAVNFVLSPRCALSSSTAASATAPRPGARCSRSRSHG